MDGVLPEDVERLWICVARVGLLQGLGLGGHGELMDCLRNQIAELDPRPVEEILSTLREEDGFRAFEESERERYAQHATASDAGMVRLLRTLAAGIVMPPPTPLAEPEVVLPGPSRAGKAGRAWRSNPLRKTRLKAAKAARRKNRRH